MDITAHNKYADDLRKMADFIQSHPELPIPIGNMGIYIHGGSSKEEARAILSAGGHIKKVYAGDCIHLDRDFGCLTFEYWFMRDAVCERVVVGQRIVPAEPEKVIPATVVPAKEARVEEVVEYHCQPILGKGTFQVDLLAEINALPEPQSTQPLLDVPF